MFQIILWSFAVFIDTDLKQFNFIFMRKHFAIIITLNTKGRKDDKLKHLTLEYANSIRVGGQERPYRKEKNLNQDCMKN